MKLNLRSKQKDKYIIYSNQLTVSKKIHLFNKQKKDQCLTRTNKMFLKFYLCLS